MIAPSNHCTIKHPMGFRWFSPSGEMPPLLLGGKAGTAMIASSNHCTIKHPMGFRWFSPSGEMPPLLLGGKAGTAMIASSNHCTTSSEIFPLFCNSFCTWGVISSPGITTGTPGGQQLWAAALIRPTACPMGTSSLGAK